MKKKILLMALAISSMALYAQKAFDEFYIDKTFQAFGTHTNKSLPNLASDALVTIDKNTVINNIRQSLFGNNAVGWQGNLNTSGTKEANWNNASYSFLRYPGGNWSNIFFWDGNTPGSILNESTLNGNVGNLKSGTTAWMLETDEYPDLLNFTGAEGIVCVNVGYAFYGTGANPVDAAAQYAADWVDYYNKQLNLGITYWELGNENYGPWQAGFDLADPQEYADACLNFASKMKAIDSTIKIGIVLYEGDGGFNNTPQANDWNEIVLPIVQDIMDYAIIHHYPHPNTNKNNISEKDIYDAIDVVHETVTMMHNQTTTYTNKQAGHYPIAITEFNSRTGVRELSRTNALFTTLMLGEYATYDDYGGAMQWDLQNGYDVDGGNHAAVATKDPFMTDGSANASLYVYYFMEKYFGDQLIASTSTDNDIVVYPTTFSSGEMGVVVVNKGATDKTVEIDLGNFAKGDRMYWHTINGDDSDFDRTIYINDQGPGTTFNVGQTYTNGTSSAVATSFEANGVGGPQNYTSIDPYSALIPATSNPKFSATRYSVSYIVFESAGTDCSIPNLGPDQSLCGLTDIILETGLNPTGLSFVWKDGGGSVLGTSAQLTVDSAGAYTVEVDNGSCIQSDEVIIDDVLPVIDLGPDVNLCTEVSVTLDAGISNIGVNYQWMKDGVPEAVTQVYEAEVAGTYSVIVSALGCTSVSDDVIISSELVNTMGDTACNSGEQVSLRILDAGNYAWYDVPVNGSELSTASVYDVSVIATKTYYVEDNNNVQQVFGKSAIDGQTYGNTGAGVYDNANRTTILTVEQDLTLESVTLFVQTNGANVVLNINGTGYSQTWNFNNLSNANGGEYVAVLGAVLPAGTYTIDLKGTVGGLKIQYDNVGSQSLTGVASFITGGGNTTWYGMFYNWVVSTGTSCARTPVVATYDPQPGCIITDLSKEQISTIQVFPNPTNGVVRLSSEIGFEVYNSMGILLLKGKSDEIDLSDLENDVYLLRTDRGVFKVIKE